MSELIPVAEPDELDRLLPDATPMQKHYVRAYVLNGGKGRKAAIEAGYEASGAAARSSELLRKPLIVKAIYELSVMQLGAHVPGALQTVNKLSRTASSDYVRLEAAKDLLDRAGFTAPKEVRVNGQVSVSIDLT